MVRYTTMAAWEALSSSDPFFLLVNCRVPNVCTREPRYSRANQELLILFSPTEKAVVWLLVLDVSVFPNPQGTCLGSRNELPLDLTVEFSCFGRGNFMPPPKAGTLSWTVEPCYPSSSGWLYALSQLQRNVILPLTPLPPAVS